MSLIKKFIHLGSKRFFKKYNKFLINETLEEISLKNSFNINKRGNSLNNYIYFSKNLNIEIIVRQLLLNKLANVNQISKSIFISFFLFKTVILFLPLNYLYVFKQKFRISLFFSSFFFYCHVFSKIISSIIIFLKFLFNKKFKFKDNSMYLFGFPTMATNFDPVGNNFMNWILMNKDSDIKSIYYNSTVKTSEITHKNINIIPTTNDALFIRLNSKQYIHFTIWFIIAATYSLFNFLFCKWWHLYLLPETLKFKYLLILNKSHLPKKIYFTLGNLVYRPMWSYALEYLGKDVILINYGPSISGVNYKKKLIHYPGFLTQTWNNRYEYSFEYINYLKQKLLFKFKYKLHANIFWLDYEKEINIKSKMKKVTVFDSTPFSLDHQLSRLYFNQLGDENFAIKFIKDIAELAESLNIFLIIKQKKFTDNQISLKYRSYLNMLESHKNILRIENISATRLIYKSDAIITYPFTSAAIIAKNLKKRVCFYKPMRKQYTDSVQSLGIHICYSKIQLKNWLKNIK